MTCVSEAPTDKLRPSGCAVRERGAALLIAISVIIGSASFRHGNTYDLAFPIDGACRLKKQKSVSGDQVIEVGYFSILPDDRTEVEARVERQTKD
jgi:hypothetical protein